LVSSFFADIHIIFPVRAANFTAVQEDNSNNPTTNDDVIISQEILHRGQGTTLTDNGTPLVNTSGHQDNGWVEWRERNTLFIE
jgi:hypothetical protein